MTAPERRKGERRVDKRGYSRHGCLSRIGPDRRKEVVNKSPFDTRYATSERRLQAERRKQIANLTFDRFHQQEQMERASRTDEREDKPDRRAPERKGDDSQPSKRLTVSDVERMRVTFRMFSADDEQKYRLDALCNLALEALKIRVDLKAQSDAWHDQEEKLHAAQERLAEAEKCAKELNESCDRMRKFITKAEQALQWFATSSSVMEGDRKIASGALAALRAKGA